MNNKKNSKKKYDITPIYNYLVAKGKEKDIKNYVIGGNFDKFAKKKGKFKTWVEKMQEKAGAKPIK